jgi:hypothetical protein
LQWAKECERAKGEMHIVILSKILDDASSWLFVVDNVVEDNVVEDNVVEDNVVEDNVVEDNVVEGGGIGDSRTAEGESGKIM